MRIVSARVRNYKSWLDTGALQFTGGFNIIIGRNNIGKTALLEGLSLSFQNAPHRSLKTLPLRGSPTDGNSRVEIGWYVPSDELHPIWATFLPKIIVSASNQTPEADQGRQFQRAIAAGLNLKCEFVGGNLNAAEIVGYGSPSPQNVYLEFAYDQEGRDLRHTSSTYGGIGQGDLVAFQMANLMRSRTYMFRAERHFPLAVSGDTPFSRR
jgi:hypothetical protein